MFISSFVLYALFFCWILIFFFILTNNLFFLLKLKEGEEKNNNIEFPRRQHRKKKKWKKRGKRRRGEIYAMISNEWNINSNALMPLCLYWNYPETISNHINEIYSLNEYMVLTTCMFAFKTHITERDEFSFLFLFLSALQLRTKRKQKKKYNFVCEQKREEKKRRI